MIKNRLNKDEVQTYIYYYFGLNYVKNYNFPAAVLVKILFSKIFFVFKVFDKGEITNALTYPVFLSGRNMDYYKINCLFVHQNYLNKIFDYDELISVENRLFKLEFSFVSAEKVQGDSIHKVFKDTKLDTFKRVKK